MYFHGGAKVIYLAHPRTASMATADALLEIGFKLLHEHHGRLNSLPIVNDLGTMREEWKVFTVVRNHFDAAVSWIFRRTQGRRAMNRDLFEWALTPPVNRWVAERTMWERHSSCVDEVLRYENLQEELNRVLSCAGLPAVTLRRRNAGVGREGRHYSEFIGSDTRQYLEKRFGEEMRRFQYG